MCRYANGSFVFQVWTDAIKATKRPILLSNCHLGCMCDELKNESTDESKQCTSEYMMYSLVNPHTIMCVCKCVCV